MPKILNKKKDKEEVKDLVPTEVEENKYLNKEEAQVLEEQLPEDEAISKVRLERLVEVVEENFDLKNKNFVMTGFAIKGQKSQVSMTNGSFDVNVTLYDNEAYGI